MKTTSLHNQSTSQTPSDGEPTQTLPAPNRTQRVAWTPPSGPRRLHVTPGGGPQPNSRDDRDFLRSLTALVFMLFLLWRLPPTHSHVKLLPVSSRLTQPASPASVPIPPPIRIRAGADSPVHFYRVAPSVPLPADE